MLQYALNDSKLVIYIFFLMIGLFYYMRKWNDCFDPKVIAEDNYFERLKSRFMDNRESPEKIKSKKSNENDMQFIFIKIYDECLKVIKLKIEDKNYLCRINIKNN